MSELSPYLVLLLVGFLPNEIWRVLGVWIGGAYWFTSSTSFANPAVTIARTLSDTFAGIKPSSASSEIQIK